jgi:pyruvate,water dikinase
METVLELSNDKISRDNSGGKASSLNQLSSVNVRVPEGFVVTTKAFKSHMDKVSQEQINDYLSEGNIKERSKSLRELIIENSVSEDISEDITREYSSLFGDNERVAVRSSATAEDTEDASFAGQQETYLNVEREDVVDKVKECWASLFTERACRYRDKHDVSHQDAEMAVVVQKMVDADTSGVLFTSNPVNGDNEITIESTWGLGEGVVSGEVTPDRFVLDGESGDTITEDISKKKKMFEWNGSETVVSGVPEEKMNAKTLSDDQIRVLWENAKKILEHYDNPQDVEWAIEEDNLYILQSRPITSIRDENMTENTDDEILVQGLGASPGKNSGRVRLVSQIDETDRVSSGDVLVTEVTTPDMVPAMQRAEAVVTDEGGMTSHAAIVSRELGVPAIVATTNATEKLGEDSIVTVDGNKGVVTKGEYMGNQGESDDVENLKPDTPVTPMTATEVKVNVSLPQAAERAAATGSDGVGLLRIEHLILGLEHTPKNYIENNGRDEFVEELVEGIQRVSEEFYARPVRVRTLDAPTDEFRDLEGGQSEPVEDNPMLGYRGIRRSLDSREIFGCQLEAYKRLRSMGYDNVEIMFPLVNDSDDVDKIIGRMESVGIDPEKHRWGVMIETPSSAIQIDSITDRPIDFVSFGTNDLTQYTLAVDRNNERVSDRFDDTHDSVIKLIKDVVEVCRRKNVDTSICGEAASKNEMIEKLVSSGVTSLSVNIDAVRDVQHEVKRREQRQILDDVIDD